MAALVLTADLGGNVPPTLAIADALVRRGVRVDVAGLDPGRSPLPFVEFAPATAINAGSGRRGATEAAAFARLLVGRRTATATRELIEVVRPGVVVVDAMLPAPLRGALDSGVPVVALFHTFGGFWVRSFDAGPAGFALGMLGLRPGRLWARAAERLVLTDPELDLSREDPALTGFTWTGTTEEGAAPRGLRNRVRVLVALSSSEWPGMLPVYRNIVAALATLPVDAVVTTGGVDLGGPVEGAENVRVLGWASHAELMPEVDLLVGHGGHSTTLKALAHGLPVLVLPVNPTSDQRLVGGTLQAAGLGAWLPKSSSPREIAAAVRGMLDDAELRRRAAATGRRLRAAVPGAEVAADRIVGLLDAGA
jgi:Glycosyl transferases, related to UDP-glucuronosyltransferase